MALESLSWKKRCTIGLLIQIEAMTKELQYEL